MNVSKYLPTAARLFLGLVFTVFGLNFFLHFLPTPAPAPRAAAFAGALFSSGYLFPLLKITEVMAGLLLLSGRFVPLALAVVAPIVINIVGFHLFLAPSGLPLAVALLATELYLAWMYRAAFAPMLRAGHSLPQAAGTLASKPVRVTA
ncbi:MAG TPA: DoxX family protein [Polyangia bacterium]|nr:DoxX family protein [Polyangia bacterium]